MAHEPLPSSIWASDEQVSYVSRSFVNVSFSTGLVYSSRLLEEVADTLSLSLAIGAQQGVHLEEFSILPKKSNSLH